MITFKKLGYYGRLGNQMFQYASLLGIADKKGVSAGIDYKNSFTSMTVNKFTGPGHLDLLEVFPHISAENSDDITPEYTINEPSFEFNSKMFDIPDNSDMSGYFQTEKYFDHIASKIRVEFQFNVGAIGAALEHIHIASEDGKVPTTCMHIRRGDYTQIQDCHPLCPRSYYTEAYEDFCEGKIIVVSDDIDWVRDNWDFPDAYYVTENSSQETDMCIIARSDHCIIANRTFSWGGAWLNEQGGSVVAPSTWFGPKYAHHNIGDLYPEGWKVI